MNYIIINSTDRKKLLVTFSFTLMLLINIFYTIQNTYAQNSIIKPLQIGDKMPDLVLKGLRNYRTSSAKISEFKGKLLILDFWATWCGSCIAAFPKMHALQKEYGSQLQVILVNADQKDTQAKVDALFKKKADASGFKVTLPYVLGEKIVAPYFPYKFIPHYVWINRDGIIVGITGSDDATVENVQAAIKGDFSKLHNKQDLFDFTAKKPLFVNGNAGNNRNIIYRSMFTSYLEGIGSSSGRSEDGKRFYMYNHSFSSLLISAYYPQMNNVPNRWIYDCDSLKKTKELLTSQSKENMFCYEILGPVISQSSIKDNLREDIKRTFGITVSSENRMLDCYILKVTPDLSKRQSQYSAAAQQFNKDITGLFIRHQTLEMIVQTLNYFLDKPLILESNKNQVVDIDLPQDMKDQQAILNALKTIGFEVNEERRELKVAVITDKL